MGEVIACFYAHGSDLGERGNVVIIGQCPAVSERGQELAQGREELLTLTRGRQSQCR